VKLGGKGRPRLALAVQKSKKGERRYEARTCTARTNKEGEDVVERGQRFRTCEHDPVEELKRLSKGAQKMQLKNGSEILKGRGVSVFFGRTIIFGLKGEREFRNCETCGG